MVLLKLYLVVRKQFPPKGNQNMGRPLCQLIKLEIDFLVGELVPCLLRLEAQALVFEPRVMFCRTAHRPGKLMPQTETVNNAKPAPGPLMRSSWETLCSLLSGQDGVEPADGASDEVVKRSQRNQQKMQRPALIPLAPHCS